MGRELSISRLDITKDGAVITDFDNTFICGRTDFTDAIAHKFYYGAEKPVSFIVLDYADDSESKEVYNKHVKTSSDVWNEKEFDMLFASASFKSILDICDEYIEKDNKELDRDKLIIEDARKARSRALNVNIFSEFSDLIDSCQDHIDNYCEDAKLFKDYIEYANLTMSVRNYPSYILLSLSE